MYEGEVTYYKSWRDGYGSCGLDRSLTDPYYVTALSRFFMKLPPNETNPNNHPLCKPQHCVQLFGARGSVVLKISDTCPECADYDVDIADDVYPKLDDPDKGRVKMSWQFVNCNDKPPGFKPKRLFFKSFTLLFQAYQRIFYN